MTDASHLAQESIERAPGRGVDGCVPEKVDDGLFWSDRWKITPLSKSAVREQLTSCLEIGCSWVLNWRDGVAHRCIQSLLISLESRDLRLKVFLGSIFLIVIRR